MAKAAKRKDSKGVVLKSGEIQRVDGRYEFRFTDKIGRRHGIYASTLKELREKEEKLLKDTYQGVSIDQRNKTLNDEFDKWKTLKVGLRDNVYQNYVYMYEAFVREELGKVKIVDIKSSDVKSFYLYLANSKHLKATTLDNIQTVLFPVFTLAIEDGIIAKNPAKNALTEIKKAKEYSSEKKKALTIEQQKAFEAYLARKAENRQWEPIFKFMLNTGMRVGEVTGLTKNDVDDDWVHVNRTLVYYDKRESKKNNMTYAINEPKTEKGKRDIPLLPQAKKALEMEKEYLEDAEIKCTAVVDGVTDFVFVNRFGENLNQGTLNKALRRIVRDYNLEEIEKSGKEKREALLLPKISTHILRHTFATRMVEKNVNAKVMQEVLGHKDIQTTMNIYVDAQNELKQNEINKMVDEDE